ncbi:hypothetical protein DICA1_A00298 [Diutina catenulata]
MFDTPPYSEFMTTEKTKESENDLSGSSTLKTTKGNKRFLRRSPKLIFSTLEISKVTNQPPLSLFSESFKMPKLKVRVSDIKTFLMPKDKTTSPKRHNPIFAIDSEDESSEQTTMYYNLESTESDFSGYLTSDSEFQTFNDDTYFQKGDLPRTLNFQNLSLLTERYIY